MGKVWTKKPASLIQKLRGLADDRIFYFRFDDYSNGFVGGNYRHTEQGSSLGEPLTQSGATLSAGTDVLVTAQRTIKLNSAGASTAFATPSGVEAVAVEFPRTWIIRAKIGAFRSQGSSLNVLVGYDGGGNQTFQISTNSSNQFKLWISGATAIHAVSMNDDKFHTVAVVWKTSTTADWYVDGEFIGEVTFSAPTQDSGRKIWIGGSGGSRYLDCEIEYLLILNRAASAGEIIHMTDFPYQIFKPKPRFALLAPQHELIESPRVWTKQPPAGTPIDRSNVIGKHITSVMVPTGFGVYEAASQSIIQYGNTDVSYHGSKLGLVGESTLVDTSGWDLPTEVYPPTGNSDRTFCAFIKPILPASPAGLITSHGQNTTGNRWSFKIQDDSGHLRIEIEGSGYTTSVLTVANDVWQCVGCALKGTTLGGHTLHVDERSESASGGNAVNTATISSGGDPSRLFGDSHGLGGGNTGIKSQVAIAAWFDSGEPWIYEEFLRNPWQIFKAPMLIVPKDIVGPPIAIVEPEVTRMPAGPPNE